MDKLHVAVLDMQPITPAIGGGRIRLLGLYSGMDADMEVVYVGSYDWRGPVFRQIKTADNLTEIEVPLSEEHFQEHDKLASRMGKSCIDAAFPLQGGLSAELIDRAKAEASAADIVIFSHPWLFPFVAPVLDPDRQLIVYDAQNCEGLLKEKLLDDGSEDAERVSRAVIKSEWELCHAADTILACSDADRDAFVKLYKVAPDKIISVPNGVFTQKIIPVENEEKQRVRADLGIDKPSFCFIGSGYEPNREAAELIIRTADILREYNFFIMGGVGSLLADFDREAHPNVTITGFLEEEEKINYLHACDLALNPMLSGSGTNIKMFDFMAAGLPIITTETGARGIDNTNGMVYMLCENSAEDLAMKIQTLLNDGNLSEKLAAGGRKEAEERYSWEKLSSKLGKTLSRQYEEKRAADKRALMISTYPPENCGIGAYARQQVAYMRANGYRVDVLAIRGNGTFSMPLNTPEGLLGLKKFKNTYDKIIIQYHASFFYEGMDRNQRIRMHQAFEELFRDNEKIEVVCHEIKFPADECETCDKDVLEENKYKVRKWLAAPHVIFHTKIERGIFCRHLGIEENSPKIEMVTHHTYFQKARDISQPEAKEELGLPAGRKAFLCIGFIQPHKAFDKVAEAFEKLGDRGDRDLYMVGSLRLVNDETKAYLRCLQKYDDDNPHIHLISSFISDEQFDTWLIAADCVVFPYKEIWSSGVLARARLFDKTCIVRDVGGLREQLGENDRLFLNYSELPGLIASV